MIVAFYTGLLRVHSTLHHKRTRRVPPLHQAQEQIMLGSLDPAVSVSHRQIIRIPHPMIDPELQLAQVDIIHHHLKDHIMMYCAEQERGRKKFIGI